MLILGIDPGSAATGYGLVESRSGLLRALTHGTITPPSRLLFLDRLPYIAAAIEALLQSVAPDGAAIAALLPILRAGVPVFEYPPRLVKKAVTGSGAAEKEQVRRMIRLLLGLGDVPLALDASDALAVAVCHAHALPDRRVRENALRA